MAHELVEHIESVGQTTTGPTLDEVTLKEKNLPSAPNRIAVPLPASNWLKAALRNFLATLITVAPGAAALAQGFAGSGSNTTPENATGIISVGGSGHVKNVMSADKREVAIQGTPMGDIQLEVACPSGVDQKYTVEIVDTNLVRTITPPPPAQADFNGVNTVHFTVPNGRSGQHPATINCVPAGSTDGDTIEMQVIIQPNTDPNPLTVSSLGGGAGGCTTNCGGKWPKDLHWAVSALGTFERLKGPGDVAMGLGVTPQLIYNITDTFDIGGGGMALYHPDDFEREEEKDTYDVQRRFGWGLNVEAGASLGPVRIAPGVGFIHMPGADTNGETYLDEQFAPVVTGRLQIIIPPDNSKNPALIIGGLGTFGPGSGPNGKSSDSVETWGVTIGIGQ